MVNEIRTETGKRTIEQFMKMQIWFFSGYPLEAQEYWLSLMLTMRGFHFCLLGGEMFLGYCVFYVENNGPDGSESISALYGLVSADGDYTQAPEGFAASASRIVGIDTDRTKHEVENLQRQARGEMPIPWQDATKPKLTGWNQIEQELKKEGAFELLKDLKKQQNQILSLIQKHVRTGCTESRTKANELIRERKELEKYLQKELIN